MDKFEQKRLILEFSMYAGLYMAVFLILRFLCFNSVNFSVLLGYLGLVMFFMTPSVMGFLIRRFGGELNACLSFGNIVRMSFQTFGMASMFMVFFACFYYTKINPELLKASYQASLEILAQSNPETAELLQVPGRVSFSPFMVALQQIFWKMLEGIFCGLILGLTFKWQNRSIKKE